MSINANTPKAKMLKGSGANAPQSEIRIAPLQGTLPCALSIEIPGGLVDEVVPAGVKLPHTTTKKFSTADSYQMAAEFHVLFGDRPLVKDNVSLCKLRVRNIQWGRAGRPQIEIKFHISKRGDITISAHNLDHLNAEVLLQQNTTALTSEEVQAIMANAQNHQEEDEATRALIKQMMHCFAQLGTYNDYYAAAKKKMSYAEQRAYKKTIKRLKKALNVMPPEATEESKQELNEAEQAFIEQQKFILPLYNQVMKWYE